jgi:hypothetical protein
VQSPSGNRIDDESVGKNQLIKSVFDGFLFFKETMIR